MMPFIYAMAVAYSVAISVAVADDPAGSVDRLLQPTAPKPLAADYRSQPTRRAGLALLEQAELMPAAGSLKPIELPAFRRAILVPRLMRDAIPLAYDTADPILPQRIELPATRLIRTPSRDVNLPLDLPVQATYRLDRASLDDPTMEYSVQQAQGGEIRQREKKAPFVRVNLPEPFENRLEIQSAQPEPPLVAPVPQPPK